MKVILSALSVITAIIAIWGATVIFAHTSVSSSGSCFLAAINPLERGSAGGASVAAMINLTIADRNHC
jgi:hypothetical protein